MRNVCIITQNMRVLHASTSCVKDGKMARTETSNAHTNAVVLLTLHDIIERGVFINIFHR